MTQLKEISGVKQFLEQLFRHFVKNGIGSSLWFEERNEIVLKILLESDLKKYGICDHTGDFSIDFHPAPGSVKEDAVYWYLFGSGDKSKDSSVLIDLSSSPESYSFILFSLSGDKYPPVVRNLMNDRCKVPVEDETGITLKLIEDSEIMTDEEFIKFLDENRECGKPTMIEVE